MTDDTEHVFMHLLANLTLLFVRCLLKSFDPLLVGCFFFLNHYSAEILSISWH